MLFCHQILPHLISGQVELPFFCVRVSSVRLQTDFTQKDSGCSVNRRKSGLRPLGNASSRTNTSVSLKPHLHPTNFQNKPQHVWGWNLTSAPACEAASTSYTFNYTFTLEIFYILLFQTDSALRWGTYVHIVW